MDKSDSERIIAINQIPDDPLKMPPPFWRSNGAIFHIVDALEGIDSLLHDLIPLHAETNIRLNDYNIKYPEFKEDDENALEEFGNITENLQMHEHKIRLKAEIACLMSAIEAEDEINRFCVYNLHRDIAESIEKLSFPEKLLVAATIVNNQSLKSDTVFESVRKLSAWRNAFAHGHCVDRPTRSLRHNHLIPPTEYPGVPSSLTETKDLVGGYLRISHHLRKISVNPYTSGTSSETEYVKALLAACRRGSGKQDGMIDSSHPKRE